MRAARTKQRELPPEVRLLERQAYQLFLRWPEGDDAVHADLHHAWNELVMWQFYKTTKLAPLVRAVFLAVNAARRRESEILIEQRRALYTLRRPER